jgi:tetratricopeptide (TPR) repeat protein
MTDTVDSDPKRRLGWRLVLRFFLALLGLFCCYRLIENAATTGVSRLLSTTAIFQSRIGPADTAVKLTPTDPEAHYTRGLALVNLERLDEAVTEFQQATRLRPHHYYEWLDLGVTLDRLGDQTAALAALRESVRLAPSFAQPRWQLGNLLFRQGQYDEAFAELRFGARSNPNLFEGLMQLAWVAADGDVETTERLIAPDSTRHHLQLASFLAKQGKGASAAQEVRDSGGPQDEAERAILHEAISTLLAAEQFSDAYSAWAATHHVTINNSSKDSVQFLNGNFLEPIVRDDPGFGWQLQVVPNSSASIDPSGPSSGTRSIRLDFSGESNLGSQPIRQLVLLQANSRYLLTFMAKTENLVSGGPPVILALAASSKNPKILGQSDPLSPGKNGWSAHKVEFATDENTSAVIVALQRVPCKQAPCPVFGTLWLGGFSLTKA